MDRRNFLRHSALTLAGACSGAWTHAAGKRPPNFIVVLCDDLGYGDIGAFGAKRVRTPNIDRMAREGTVLTDYYAAANLCTPSRAGLLTGRYPIRTGLAYEVIMQTDTRGLPQSEVTIAEALKPDYATALIGKWHLGHIAPYWPPTTQGFDLFFGLPYSHDMKPLSLYEGTAPGVELTREDVDYPQLQQRFWARAERFIEENHSRPFFLDLALSAPHLPNYPDSTHAGHSGAGAYGTRSERSIPGITTPSTGTSCSAPRPRVSNWCGCGAFLPASVFTTNRKLRRTMSGGGRRCRSCASDHSGVSRARSRSTAR